MIRLAVHGAKGRMGARIVALASEDDQFTIVAALDIDDAIRPDALAPRSVDVVIDFSSDAGARSAASLAANQRAALLVGTTGLSPQTLEALADAARHVPVMVAANTSLGVAVASHLAAEAARLLARDFDIDIIETHHAAKKDAPSGTALRLAQAIEARSSIELPPERIHAIRAGDVIGEHTIEFAGPGERIRITHMATSRDLFARGALRAAAWLHGRDPGRYTIEQSLGVETPKRRNAETPK